MSDKAEDRTEENSQNQSADVVKLDGVYAFKLGMSTLYHEGQAIPVTVLQFRPWFVSQLKNKERDGYEAVQIACSPKRASRSNRAEKGHLKASGFENGAHYVREIRQALPEGVQVGQKVDITSLASGDLVDVTGLSKGRGFSGAVKRWNFGGGPASHGSTTHRRTGSIGNNKEPGRVMPGRKMPGHFGNETSTTAKMKVVEVLPEKGILMVKGAVPGARHSIVKLMKV
ncbi:MAG: 50S ribosomal protein L3 [Bdellovibrionales bacterium]|nr:50S ribosomal protein L3 [Bdellovibrionales bacterium]